MKQIYARVALLLFAVATCCRAESTSDQGQRTCDNVRCSEGTHCVMQEVQCFRAPCYPIPVCEPEEITMVSSSSPCDTVRCRGGYTCIEEQPACFAAPCPPLARCKTIDSDENINNNYKLPIKQPPRH